MDALADCSKSDIQIITNIKDFDFTGPELGRGSYGVVIMGKWLKAPTAIKSVDCIGNVKDLYLEIGVLSKLSHENIIHLIAVCFKSPKLHILIGLFKGHCLKDVLFEEMTRNKYNLNEKKKFSIATKIGRAVIPPLPKSHPPRYQASEYCT